MPPSIQLDPRYIVLKVTDVRKYLDQSEINSLVFIDKKISVCRKDEGKEPFNAVVIESDWPEFAEVQNKLSARIYKEKSPVEITFTATNAGYYLFDINGRSFSVFVQEGQTLAEAAKESGMLTPAELQFLDQGK